MGHRWPSLVVSSLIGAGRATGGVRVRPHSSPTAILPALVVLFAACPMVVVGPTPTPVRLWCVSIGSRVPI